MSAFLGPIHYWLFNKILHIEDRAFAIANALKDKGKDTEVDAKINEYGQRLAGADLAELVGDNSIHNFLYGLISKVEVFEAGLVALAGDDFETARKAVEDHGRASAAKAVEQKGAKPDDLNTLYQYVADYQLEGMPCDPGAEVDPAAQNKLTYGHTTCNHMSNWEYTECPASKMCEIHNAWLQGFVEGLNGSAKYTVKDTIAGGAPRCEAEITL